MAKQRNLMPSAQRTSFLDTRVCLDLTARGVSATLALAKQLCGMLVRPAPRFEWEIPSESGWQRLWGADYGADLKRWLLPPVFDTLERERKIGSLIVDIGCGAMPVTRLLKPMPGRKRILVDIASDNSSTADEQGVRLDVEKIGQPDALSLKKALLRACKFLKANPRDSASRPAADTMIFSDLLNYVDFRKVLGGFATYLKPGGRIIINNLPIRGNHAWFSDQGLKDNEDLLQFLHEHGFEIEKKLFPCRPTGVAEESQELIVLVARKGC